MKKISSKLNPRAKRVRQINELLPSPFDIEKFIQFDQQPFSQYDLYQRKLLSKSMVMMKVYKCDEK